MATSSHAPNTNAALSGLSRLRINPLSAAPVLPAGVPLPVSDGRRDGAMAVRNPETVAHLHGGEIVLPAASIAGALRDRNVFVDGYHGPLVALTTLGAQAKNVCLGDISGCLYSSNGLMPGGAWVALGNPVKTLNNKRELGMGALGGRGNKLEVPRAHLRRFGFARNPTTPKTPSAPNTFINGASS